MKNSLLIFVMCAIWTPLLSQLPIPIIKNTSTDKIFTKDSLVQSLVDKSEIVVMFRTYSVWNWDSPFRAIYYTKEKTWRYCKLTTKNKQRSITQIDIPQDSIIKIWQAFVNNDLFQLADEKESKANCSAIIIDSRSYDFRIITKTKYKKLFYYDPEFFEEQCPGNIARQKIINCAKVVFSHYY